jgi:hypothetical protein
MNTAGILLTGWIVVCAIVLAKMAVRLTSKYK